MNAITEKIEKAHCEKHGEYEHKVREFFGTRIKVGCSACIEERDAEAQRKREAEEADRTRRQWEAKVGRSGIPERFHDRTLDSYRAETEGQQRALAFAKAYADDFDSVRKNGKSALFLGKPGTGKTHLSIGIALQVMQSGRSALFCTVMRAVRRVKDTWSKGGDMTETEAINSLVFPDLLILDEVGVQFGSDTEKLLLFDVLNERYERRRPTLMLSNLALPEVKAFLGERIFDRLREDGGEVIVFDWVSHRGRA